MTDCLFCKIVNGDIPGDLVYEDDEVIGFRDVSPQAPQHILFIPREHISTLNDLDEKHASLAGKLVLAARQVAKEQGVAEEGYRTVINCNSAGGQSVFHIHLHLLAGRQMGWPPG